ncbi:leukemia inhibitory factor receptor-like isoform X2 [Hyperolius riggenbachi]|uniref:leukemia inhibitory factor receptor-like isoform X2 n=1 Tax=Hyperolius riggenbachi TaxID=752182 RepID=UPI0035A2A478
MIRVITIIILTIPYNSGLPNKCDFISNCQESPEWQGRLFCDSNFNRRGKLFMLKCNWSPYPSSSTIQYKLHQTWWVNTTQTCKDFGANETFRHIAWYEMRADAVNTFWVSVLNSNHTCVKTKSFSVVPNVNCKAPFLQHAVQSSSLLRFQLDRIGQLRYRNTATDQWHTINVTTSLSTHIELPASAVPMSFTVQQRCLHQACFHCKWTEEKRVPRELIGAPDIIVTSEKLSPGKQRATIEWKYTMHDHVDEYIVTIQKLPRSCIESDIIIRAQSTQLYINLSIAFFNVSVIGYNEAGNSSSASAVLHPLTAPELPGNLFATYGNGSISLTWTPLFDNDFCVISWGTSYAEMKYEIPNERLQNYSIQVPRTGPLNLTVKNVTKTSAVIEWAEIPEEDCPGFLLSYRIYCIDTSRNTIYEVTVNSSSQRSYRLEGLTKGQKYEVKVSGMTVKGEGQRSAPCMFRTLTHDEGEFQVILLSACVGLMIAAVIVVSVCAYTLHRTRKLYFPEIPNPKHSQLCQIVEEPGAKVRLFHLIQPHEEEANYVNSNLEVILELTDTSLLSEDRMTNKDSKYLDQCTPMAHVPPKQDYSSMKSMLNLLRRLPHTVYHDK